MRGRGRGGGPLMIRVSIEQLQPLAGSAAAQGGEERRFRGWLEMLHALSELVAVASGVGDRRDAPPDDRR